MTWNRISISSFLLLLLLLHEELSILFVVAGDLNNAINGRHLMVAFTKTFPAQVEIIRDTQGVINNVSGVGPLMLSWLSIDLNFTWSIIQTNKDFEVDLVGEDDVTSSGRLRYFLQNEMCDLAIGTIIPIYSRFEWMDFLHGHMDGSAVMIIKKPELVNENIRAIAKPFQLWVWIGLFLALVIALYAVYLINRYFKNQTTATNTTAPSSMNFTQWLYYVLRVILIQSGVFLRSKRLAIRFIAASWCLLAFVIVHAYKSVLISYISTPDMGPSIVESLTDLAKKSNVQLLVEQGMPIDSFLTSYANSLPNLSDYKATSWTSLENVYRSLGKRLDKYPESRCTSQQRCIDLVKGGNSALIRVISSATDIIEKDFFNSGRHCNLALAKDKWSNTMWGWAVAKNSPYIEAFNMGILRMNEAGLTEKWRRRFQRNGNHCSDNDKGKDEKANKKRNQRITLKNIAGSFVVLLIGMFSSNVVFTIELILRRQESTTVAVLTAAKTCDARRQIKKSAVKDKPAPHNKLNNTDNKAIVDAAPDNESSVIVTIQTVSPVINTELEFKSIQVGEELRNKELPKQMAINLKVLVAAKEVINNSIESSPVIVKKINETSD